MVLLVKSLILASAVAAIEISPASVVSARCTSTLNPNGSNNEFGINDPAAAGGEPAATCMADETANAKLLLTGGQTVFRAASGSGKGYVFTYDFGSVNTISSLELEGTSTGHWCEDGLMGAVNCHNDNGFSVSLSKDGSTWTGYNSMAGISTIDACSRLDDGCGWTFSPVETRYFRLKAQSSCAGCSNQDYVTKITSAVELVSPAEVQAVVATNTAQQTQIDNLLTANTAQLAVNIAQQTEVAALSVINTTQQAQIDALLAANTAQLAANAALIARVTALESHSSHLLDVVHDPTAKNCRLTCAPLHTGSSVGGKVNFQGQ